MYHENAVARHNHLVSGAGDDCGRAGSHAVNAGCNIACIGFQLIVDGLSGKDIAARTINPQLQILAAQGFQILSKLLRSYIILIPAGVGYLPIQNQLSLLLFGFVFYLPEDIILLAVFCYPPHLYHLLPLPAVNRHHYLSHWRY